MTRIQALAAHPKRTLGVLALVLVAVGVAVGSGADFSAQSANPGNTFTAGTLTMDNSKDGTAILSVGASPGWKPGQTETGTVDIQNTGSLAGTFSLSRDQLTNSDGTNPMSDKVDLVVEDCGTDLTCGVGDVEKYNGTLTAMNSSIALGTFAAAEEHRYEFTATFNSSAGNVYQGDNTSARFVWDAVQ
jgi:spore coat-associated protein N